MVRYVILLIILCGCFLSTSAISLKIQKPSNQESTAAINTNNSKDATQARMLYHMAVWKWKHQAKKTTQMPSLDSTGVDAFIESVKKGDTDGDPAGINTVYNKVGDKLGKSFFSSSAEEVAYAIEETLNGRYSQSVDTEEFIEMLSYIKGLASQSPPKTGAKPVPNQGANPDHGPAKKIPKLNIIESHPYLFSLGGLLLGLFFGVSLGRLGWKRNQKYLNERIDRRDKELSSLKNDINKLKRDKELIEEKFKGLTNELRTQNDKNLYSGEKAADSVENVTQRSSLSEFSIQQPLDVGHESKPAPKKEISKTLYAPAAEDPFIEPSKVYCTYSGAAAVMLTIDPRNPNRAEFEFSPYADQTHIINTSITQLDQFFEYTLPSRGFSKIKSAGKGTLLLENGNWVRKSKARLELQ